MVKTDKKLTELAGMYAAAAQLALHGWHSSPTVSGFPQIDLHAFKPGTGKRLTIQVKARAPDQRPNAVRQGDGMITTGGGWGVGTWKLGSTFDPRVPYFKHASQDMYWCLGGFAYEADYYVLVWFEQGEKSTEFFVVPSSSLRLLLSSPDGYLRKYSAAKDQPCWIGNELVSSYKNRWDLLDQQSDEVHP